MNTIKSKVLFSFAVLFGFLIFSPVLAAENCSQVIDEKLNALLEVKDNYYIYGDEKANKMHQARQKLLSSIISCSREEIIELKENLESLKKISSEDEQIKKYFISQLEEFIKYFEAQEENFNQVKNKKDKIKDLAQEIYQWRQDTYNPLIKDIVNFSFVLKQDSIIITAFNRLNKINNSLNIILSVKNQEINNLLASAQEKITTAQDLNQQAYQLIDHNLQPLRIELNGPVATTTPSDDQPPSNEGEENPSSQTEGENEDQSNQEQKVDLSEKVPALPQDLIKQSLDKIKEAYQDFFKLSSAVKDLLGF